MPSPVDHVLARWIGRCPERMPSGALRIAVLCLIAIMGMGEVMGADVPTVSVRDPSNPRVKINSSLLPYLDLPAGAQSLDAHIRRMTVPASQPDRLMVRLDSAVTDATLATVAATGAVVLSTSARWNVIMVEATASQIDALARLDDVHLIAPAYRPRHHGRPAKSQLGLLQTGPTPPTSGEEADGVMTTNQVRSTYSVTGAGRVIGVISDSFNLTSAIGSGTSSGSNPSTVTHTNPQIAGFLPTSIYVCNTGASVTGPTDEGEAMLEVLHQVAPGATLGFSSCGASQTDMATSIVNLHSQVHCTLICDDVGFPDEPMFQDGPIAQAANTFYSANNGIYLSAAGNEADAGILIAYTQVAGGGGDPHTGGLPNGHNFLDWGISSTTPSPPSFPHPPVGYLPLTITGPSSLTVTLEWNQPYQSYNLDTSSGAGNQGSNSDFDLYLYSVAGTPGANILTASTTGQGISNSARGGDPVEIVQQDFDNSFSYPLTVYLAVDYYAGISAGAQMRLVASLEGADVASPYYTKVFGTASSFGHPTATNVLGMGAAYWNSNPLAMEYFTSKGGWGTSGIQYYYDITGTALSPFPQTRNAPLLTAPDGMDWFYNPAFVPFYGTSCATPNATGAAALAWCVQPGLTNQQIMTELEQSATDMVLLDTALGGPTTSIPAGADAWSGNGMVNAITSIGKSFTSASTITGSPIGTLQSGTVTINVQFTNPVTFSTPPTLILNTSPQEVATYVSGIGTSTLTFTYNITVGDVASVLDVVGFGGGAITSVTGSVPFVATPPPIGGIGSLGVNDVIDIAAGLFATTIVGSPAASNQPSFSFTITFAQAETASPAPGITLSSNAHLGALTGGPTVWTQAVTATGPGLITLTVAAHTVTETAVAGLQNQVGSGSVDYDLTPPTVTITPQPDPVATNGSLLVTFTFDKPVTGFSDAKVSVSGGSIAGVMQGTGSVYTMAFTAGAPGTLTITVNAAAVTDLAGNVFGAATSASVQIVNPASSSSSKCGGGGVFGFLMLSGLFWLRRFRRV